MPLAEFFDVREHRLPQKVEAAAFVVCVSAHGRSQLMNFVTPQHWDKLRHIEGAAQRVQEDTMRFATTTEFLGGNLIDSVIVIVLALASMPLASPAPASAQSAADALEACEPLAAVPELGDVAAVNPE